MTVVGRWRRWAGAWALGAAAVVLLACERGPEPYNVLILTLDTTRGDHFGSTGYEEAATPNFDRWSAERAVQFDNAISAAPITFPSHTSIMTGTLPAFHGVRDNDGFYLDDKITTLAEILQQEDFTTAAFIAAFPLDSGVNLDQGFDLYDDDLTGDWSEAELRAKTPMSFGITERTADKVNLAMSRWLKDHRQERFFAWMHYFDPHQAYEPPAPYDSQFSSAPYDGEIAFVDEQFGALLDLLREEGRLERTIIAVIGDHGEGLGEHSEQTHAVMLYDQTVRVPFWISVPGRDGTKGSRIRQQVRTIDLAPTVLDLLGLPSGPDMQGQSLVPLMDNPDLAWEGEALSECFFQYYHYGWAPLRSLRTDQWKYIRGPEPELYDLENDPGELLNVAPRRPEMVAEMDERMERYVRRVRTDEPARSVAASVDPEARARLQALGYVGGGAGDGLRAAPFPTTDALAGLINPMDSTLVLAYINTAHNQLRLTDFNGAIDSARRGLNLDPENAGLHVSLGRAYAGLGVYEPALAAFDRALALRPEMAEAHAIKGQIYLIQEDSEAALNSLARAIELVPSDVKSLRLAARTLSLLGRYQEAVEHLEAVLETDTGDWALFLELGQGRAQLGEIESARAAFQQALERNPYSSRVLYDIGVFYRHQGDVEFSQQMFRGVIKVSPLHVAARVHLAEIFLEGADEGEAGTAARAEAKALLEQALENGPSAQWAERAQALLTGL